MSPWTAAFDTSGPLGTVAAAPQGQRPGCRFLLTRGAHGSHLVPALEDVLAERGGEPAALDRVVVGAGPGSFTGIRVAAATARGLVRGTGAHLYAFSSLAAAAVSERSVLPPHHELPAAFRDEWSGPGRTPDLREAVRYVLFDARADRLYAACYRFLSGRIEELEAPEALTLDELLSRPLAENVLFCGDGAHRHAEVLDNAGYRVLPFPAGLPTAEGLLRVHALDPEPRAEAPDSRWEPDYLRPSQPERA